MTDENNGLKVKIDGLTLESTRKESIIRELRQNLDIRNINCNEAEASIRHLN